jgi:hypothetical protein
MVGGRSPRAGEPCLTVGKRILPATAGAGESSIEFMLVLAKLLPMFRFEPERIAADPHPLAAHGQGAAELLAPAAGDPIQIELISLEIPLGTLKDLDVPVCGVSSCCGLGLSGGNGAPRA